MTQGLKEAARMWVIYDSYTIDWLLIIIHSYVCVWFSIYSIHDEVKDKAFELEMSWVGEGKYITLVTNCLLSHTHHNQLINSDQGLEYTHKWLVHRTVFN